MMRPCLPLLALLMVWAPQALSYTLMATSTGTPIHWTVPCIEWWVHPQVPVELTPDQVQASLEAAARPWNNIPGSYISLIGAGATCFNDVGLSAHPGAQNVVLWHDSISSWPHAKKVIALTSVTVDAVTGELLDADIEFNGEDFTFGVNGEAQLYDLQQAATHEFGHLLGLDHSLDLTATMHERAQPGEVERRELAADDIAALERSHPITKMSDQICPTLELVPVNAPFCPAPAPPETGCTAAKLPVSATLALLVSVLFGWERRRRKRA